MMYTFESLQSFVGSIVDYGYGKHKIVSVFETSAGFRFGMKVCDSTWKTSWANVDIIIHGPTKFQKQKAELRRI